MTQLLQNAVFGTALILAAALLRRALGGRLIPEARLALWAVCLARLLAPVFPASGLSLWGLLPRAGTAPAAAPVIDPVPVPSGAGANLPAANIPAPVEPAGAAFPWGAALAAVWLGVGLALAARYALRWNRTRRAVAQAIPLGRDDPRYAPLPKCARLREGVMDGAPLTFGAARPTVVVPPGLDGGALDCVLAHEAVHAARRDNLWHYGMAAALALYWWNPAVWLMARLLRRDVELACDRAAVRRLGAERRAEYARTLVALATASDGPAFCQTFGRKAAEERILSVMKFRKTTIFGAVLTAVLVVGVTVAFASAPKAPAAGQEGDPNNDTPYVVCANPLCGVEYQHCHINGEVVRAYDEYPGLLCAHPDCEIEGPHEHDGVRYAGKAGKFVILNGDAGPAPSAAPAEKGVPATVTYHGRTYNRADLSAETLEWLEWYLDLSEEEQMAVSYEPWELREQEMPGTQDAEQPVPDFVPDYDPKIEDSAGAGDDIICGLPTAPTTNCGVEGCTETRVHQHEGSTVVQHYSDYPAELPVCPVEGCTAWGAHTHDGVTYLCNGAHSGGVCDRSCGGWNEADTAPTAAPVSSGHHSDSHHGNGYHGGHH